MTQPSRRGRPSWSVAGSLHGWLLVATTLLAGRGLAADRSSAHAATRAAPSGDPCVNLHAAAVAANPRLMIDVCVEGTTERVHGPMARRLLEAGASVGRCGGPTPTAAECEAILTAFVYWIDDRTRAADGQTVPVLQSS